MERLTDAHIEAIWHFVQDGNRPCMSQQEQQLALAELRTRRVADLSAEEMEALDRLLRELKLAVLRDDENCFPHYRACVAALDRLIGKGDGKYLSMLRAMDAANAKRAT